MLAVKRWGGAMPRVRSPRARATSDRVRVSSCVTPGPAKDHHVLQESGKPPPPRRHLLERDQLAAPVAAIGGHQHLALQSLMRPERDLALKPPKITVCGASDPGTRQQGDHQLRNQRHVNGDDVPFLHAELFEHIRESGYFAKQVLISKHPAVARLTLPDDRRLVAVRAVAVPIDAVLRGVQRPAVEPLCKRRLHSSTSSTAWPSQQLRLFPPEPRRGRPWLVPSARTAQAADVCLPREILGRWEDTRLLQHAGNRAATLVRSHDRRSPSIMKLDGMAQPASRSKSPEARLE